MKTSKAGLDLIKHFEGCELKAYECAGGVLTWGWGHTRNVIENGEISQEKADELLIQDIEEIESQVESLVTVELNQHQWDAILSWTFNLGCGNLRSSTLLKVLNEGKYDKVSEQIVRWDKASGKVLAGLTRRRRCEAILFDTDSLDFGEPYVG